MALVEIEDGELDTLRKGMALLSELSNNSEAKRPFQQALKKIRPDIRTEDEVIEEAARPYIDEIKSVKGEFEAFKTQFEADRTRAAEEAEIGKLNKAFSDLRDNRGFTDSGLDKIKQIMVDTNTADPYVAASYYESQNPKPPAEAAAWEPDSLDIRNNAVEHDVKTLFDNEDLWADRMVSQVLSEERRKAAA